MDYWLFWSTVKYFAEIFWKYIIIFFVTEPKSDNTYINGPNFPFWKNEQKFISVIFYILIIIVQTLFVFAY